MTDNDILTALARSNPEWMADHYPEWMLTHHHTWMESHRLEKVVCQEVTKGESVITKIEYDAYNDMCVELAKTANLVYQARHTLTTREKDLADLQSKVNGYLLALATRYPLKKRSGIVK